MKKSLIIGMAGLLALMGCSDKKSGKNVHVGRLTATHELAETGSKRFRLDTETKNRPPYLQICQDGSGERLLTFLNPRKNAIYFYRYADTTYVKQIAFEREGGNAILSASGYCLKSPDSIYVMNRPMMEVVLTDSLGQVRSRTVLLDKENKEWALTHPQYLLSAVAPLTIKDNHLLLPGFAPFPQIIMENRERFRFTAAVDLSTQAISYHHLYPESLFGKEANWGGDLMQMVYPAFTPEGKMIHSFPNSHDLYLSEWNSDEMTPVYAGSNEVESIHPLDCKPDENVPDEQLLSFFLEQDWYAAVLHDPYQKVYYRYLQKAVSPAASKKQLNGKVLSVIIMDEQFRYLGETEIGTGEQWNWNNSFVTPEGLHIEHCGTKMEDDDYLTFGIFQPKAK
ncbi:DUF4221 family protein [uncultured Bacteroides sp.]|uniref:DUF4221 family protein n=3 Tax=uncultured Bacteroides sp. TaxID=162156 RepID=UPI0025D17488|nr:DUF4221 family protein [uncultured Bacteroides sp.]